MYVYLGMCMCMCSVCEHYEYVWVVWGKWVYTYIYTYINMYVSLYMCAYACMCVYACTCICMFVGLRVRDARTHAISIHACLFTHAHTLSLCYSCTNGVTHARYTCARTVSRAHLCVHERDAHMHGLTRMHAQPCKIHTNV